MPFPTFSSLETPILQELSSVGGSDDLRFLYERLIAYFPQINQIEISEIKTRKNKSWRKLVQRAGKSLDDQNLITRQNGVWEITTTGINLIEDEFSGFTLTKTNTIESTHSSLQSALVNIGKILGYDAQVEYEYYDVVWRSSPKSQRLSHIFEVQSKGNIDSAFAKLKRGYEAQRSKPFLVLSTERDFKRAIKSLANEFHDLENVITILTFPQVLEVFENIRKIDQILNKFLEK